MINKNKKNEQGFVLPLALLVLVVMSIMAATLVTITSKDHAANNSKDSGQQAFYAAESGISVAKQDMIDRKNLITTSSTMRMDRDLRFCKASFFPNVKSDLFPGLVINRRNLSEFINASGKEAERLGKFSFEVIITFSPDSDGNIASNKASAKKKPGTSQVYYTIYSCGCNAEKQKCDPEKNIIIPLEAVVTLVE